MNAYYITSTANYDDDSQLEIAFNAIYRLGLQPFAGLFVEYENGEQERLALKRDGQLTLIPVLSIEETDNPIVAYAGDTGYEVIRKVV